MSITVTEDFKGQSAHSEVDGLWLNMAATRRFDVRFENDTNIPAARPLLALDQPDIPKPWDSHPGNQWMYVESRSVDIIGPVDYSVTVNYRLRDNPLAEAAKVSWSHVDVDEYIDIDINGRPITNSANELFDPPTTETFHDLVLRIEQNEMTFDPLVASYYKNKLNGTYVLGFMPGMVKCTVFEGEQTRAASTFFWVVRVEFQFRSRIIKNEQIGWKIRRLDAGFRELVSVGDNNYQFKTVRDSEGYPATEPVLLDGHGKRLADGAEPVWKIYETKEYADFNNLHFRFY